MSGIAVGVTCIAALASTHGRIVEKREQIAAIAISRERAAKPLEHRSVDVTHSIRDLLGACDLESLSALDRFDILRRFEQRLVRAGVEPCHAASHDFALELAQFEIAT